MNKILAVTSVSMLALSAGAAKADYVLDILHINDMHSRIESINRFNSTCSAEDETEKKCFGGVGQIFEFKIFDVTKSKALTSNEIISPFFKL